MNDQNNVFTPNVEQNEVVLEKTLRPTSMDEFLGQKKAKEAVSLALEAAKSRGDTLDHLLIYGPPGIGKTTLAFVIAQELGTKLHITSGPAIERAGDVASLLTNLETGDILFIDEIHRLHRVVEETLYAAMEDYSLDIILGKGPAARNVRIKLKPFTLIGATTKFGSLTSPLRSRFGMVQKLEFYTPHELEAIVKRSAKLMGVNIVASALKELSSRSRGTPRIANRLLRRARDVAEVRFDGSIDDSVLSETFRLLEIDEYGLDRADRQVLDTIIRHHQGGPVGVQTIANTISEDETTIEEVYEPFLIQAGFLKRTKNGRMVTDLAYRHLGLSK